MTVRAVTSFGLENTVMPAYSLRPDNFSRRSSFSHTLAETYNFRSALKLFLRRTLYKFVLDAIA